MNDSWRRLCLDRCDARRLMPGRKVSFGGTTGWLLTLPVSQEAQTQLVRDSLAWRKRTLLTTTITVFFFAIRVSTNRSCAGCARISWHMACHGYGWTRLKSTLAHIQGCGLGAASGLAYIAHVVDMKSMSSPNIFRRAMRDLVGISPRSTWRSVSVAQRPVQKSHVKILLLFFFRFPGRSRRQSNSGALLPAILATPSRTFAAIAVSSMSEAASICLGFLEAFELSGSRLSPN